LALNIGTVPATMASLLAAIGLEDVSPFFIGSAYR